MPWTQVQLLSLCGPHCSSIHISLQLRKLTEILLRTQAGG